MTICHDKKNFQKEIKYVLLLALLTVCQIGYYGPGSTCNQCPTGQYSDAEGLSACKNCGAGLTTTAIGATASSQCGKFIFKR